MAKFRYSIITEQGGYAVYDRNKLLKRFDDQSDADRYVQRCIEDDRHPNY